MNKIPLTPPPIPPLPSEDDIKNSDWEKIKQNPANKKYEKLLAEQIRQNAAEELKMKKERRSEWWKNNWLNIVAATVTVIGIIVALIGLL